MQVSVLNKLLLNFSPSFHRLFIVFFIPFIFNEVLSKNYIESYVNSNFLFILFSSGISFYFLGRRTNTLLISYVLLSIPSAMYLYLQHGLLSSYIFIYFHFYQIARSEAYNNKPIIKQLILEGYYFTLLVLSCFDIFRIEWLVFMCVIPICTYFNFEKKPINNIFDELKSIITYGATGFLTASVPFFVIKTVESKVSDLFIISLTQCAVFISLFLLVLRYFSINYLASDKESESEAIFYLKMRNQCAYLTVACIFSLPIYFYTANFFYDYKFTNVELACFSIFYISCTFSILSFPFSMLCVKRGIERKNLQINLVFFICSLLACELLDYINILIFWCLYCMICLLRGLVSLNMGNKYVYK